jgi:hypothetical protein
LAKQAQDFARRTTRQVSDFVRERELDKKAAAAYADASESVRTNYMRLDAEWDLSGRLNSMQGRLNETAQVGVPWKPPQQACRCCQCLVVPSGCD